MNICGILTWLNQNAGATIAILTAVYVIATIIIVLFNHKIVTEMRLNREEQVKPKIVTSFESRRGGLLCLVLRNLGGSTASNLRIELSNEFVNRLPENQEKFKGLISASLTIVPKQEIIYCCGGPKDFEALSKDKIKGRIMYTDIFKKEHEEMFALDVESYRGALLYGPGMDELTTTIKQGLKELKPKDP